MKAAEPKAAEDSRTPKPRGIAWPVALRGSVLECGCPLPLSGPSMVGMSRWSRISRWLLLGIHLPALLLLAVSVATPTAASPPPFLHTQGKDIINERAEKVLLRGVGLG